MPAGPKGGAGGTNEDTNHGVLLTHFMSISLIEVQLVDILADGR